MVKNLPDKYIRKAVYDAINNMAIDGKYIKCYDYRMTGSNYNNYILMTTQSNTVDKRTKCGYDWESSILIEIYTRYKLTGNTGSRLEADNILDKARELTNELILDVESNLEIITQRQSFPNDLITETDTEIIIRKFMRIEFLIE